MTIYCDTTFFIGHYVAIEFTFDERQLATATATGLKAILPNGQ